MSIPVRFNFYNNQGKLLVENYGFFTISYGQDPRNLTYLSKMMAEYSIDLYRKYIHYDVKYAVPLSATDYMFNLENLNYILPNKFKE